MCSTILLPLVAALAGALAGPAVACSFAGNPYDIWERQSIEALVARSASIEHIVVHPSDTPLCPDAPSRRDEAAFEAWRSTLPPMCSPDGNRGRALEGEVVERFAGDAPVRINLFLGSGGRRSYFSDIDDVSEHFRSFPEQFEAHRIGLHATDAFWTDPGIDGIYDYSDSCGGAPTLRPGGQYVVFRNADGGVIASEPVGPDDPLIRWLRLPVGDSDRSARLRFSAEQLFRAASHLAEVRVTRCRRSDPEWSDWTYQLWGRQVRGNDAEIFIDDGDPQTEDEELQFGDWLDWRRRRCALISLLVVEMRSSGGTIPPMPAVIRGGSVSVRDLFPGVIIVGDDRVSVDQAFAWFDAANETR